MRLLVKSLHVAGHECMLRHTMELERSDAGMFAVKTTNDVVSAFEVVIAVAEYHLPEVPSAVSMLPPDPKNQQRSHRTCVDPRRYWAALRAVVNN